MAENPSPPPEDLLVDGDDEGSRGGGAHHTVLMVDHLRKTRPWVLFLTVLGFLGAGVMIIFAVVMALLPALSSTTQDAPGALAAVFMGVFFYGGIGAFFLFFSVLLFRYARAIGRLIVGNRTEDMEHTIDAQRGLFKATGIATIAIFGLFILSIVGMVIFSMVLVTGQTLP